MRFHHITAPVKNRTAGANPRITQSALNGQPAKFDAGKASAVMSQKEHTITVDLGAGKYSDYCYGCDLSRDYVTINADYHT